MDGEDYRVTGFVDPGEYYIAPGESRDPYYLDDSMIVLAETDAKDVVSILKYFQAIYVTGSKKQAMQEICRYAEKNKILRLGINNFSYQMHAIKVDLNNILILYGGMALLFFAFCIVSMTGSILHFLLEFRKELAVHRMVQEKEVSGLYLSGHPLDAYREQSARFASHAIKALTGEDAHVLDNSHVRIVCTIVKNRMMTTKSNTMMAFTSVEDLTGTMEVIVFPRVLDTFRDSIKENAVVVIEGRLSVREDEPAKLMAESILPIEGYDPKHPQANKPNLMRDATQRLYIRLPSRTCPEYAKVINLLEIFDGDMPVIFYLEDTKQKLAAPRRLYTSGHPLFFQELKRVVGVCNVATK